MMKTIFELSKQGVKSNSIPLCTVLNYEFNEKYIRNNEVNLPEVDEASIFSHYRELEQDCVKTCGNDYFSISMNGFYPDSNEENINLEAFKNLHPLQKKREIQGVNELIFRLQDDLKKITGMDGFSLQPSDENLANLAILKIIKKYFKDNNQTDKNKIIMATSVDIKTEIASLCGFEIIKAPLKENGTINFDELKSIFTNEVGCVIASNPTYMGIFDENIVKISEFVHSEGALMCYIGDNFNTIMGIVKPFDMGFDIVELNLNNGLSGPMSKGFLNTFAVGVIEKLSCYLPGPLSTKDKSSTYSLTMPEKTIGQVGMFNSNFDDYVRSYSYLTILGKDGIRNISETTLFNINYLRVLLCDFIYDSSLKFSHKVILSFAKIKKLTSLKANEITQKLQSLNISCKLSCTTNNEEIIFIDVYPTYTIELLQEMAEKIVQIIQCK